MQEEMRKMVKDLSKNMDKLNKMKKFAFSKLNEEQLKAIAPMQKDINLAMSAMKKGDTQILTDIITKYAGTNRE